MAPGAVAQDAPPDLDFQGRPLVAASDGDMQAQACAGEESGSPMRDTLSVIRLGTGGMPVLAGTIKVASSVVGPPVSLSITPDGRNAVVIEIRGPQR